MREKLIGKSYKIFRKGALNAETLTVQFGGEHSKPENIFTAKAVKVPDFKYTVMEQEDAGGGCYYNGKIPVEYTEKNAYLVVRGNEIIGWMRQDMTDFKKDLYPLDWKHTWQAVRDFAEKLKTELCASSS